MIKVYPGKKIEEITNIDYRQYFAGHLERPQLIDAIDDDIEIGISNYKEFTADKPHVHPVCSEYGYIISGVSKVLLLDCNEEYTLKEGDFFHISKGTPYASKHAKGTKVLFIKAPSNNDKTLVEITEDLDKWMKSWN